MKQDCFFLVRNIRIFLAMRKVNFSLFPSPVLLPQVAWNPMPKSAVLQNILFYFPASTECRPTGHVSGEEKTDCEYVCVCAHVSCSVESNSLGPHGL